MRQQFVRLAIGAALSSLLAGCVASAPPVLDVASPPSAPLAKAGPDGFPGMSQAIPIRAMDRISVRVLREPELSLADVRIDEDGHFDMPHAGRIRAEGRQAAEIAEEIRLKLGQSYLVDPRVSVNVIDYSSNMVTVEGAVAQPGIYSFQHDTTLLGAIALARGPSRVAKLNEVAIFRQERGERSVAVFDLRKVRSGEMVDPVLKPGDRVLIGFSGLAQAWQDFLTAAPLIAVFTRF